MTARSIGSGSRSGGQLTGVGPLHRDHARIVAQRLGELATPDVEGVHANGATLQQHVREAAGRGAHVERRQAGRIDLEGVERRGQLVAAAADVRLGRRDGHRRARIDEIARLAVVPGGIALPHPDLAGQHERLRPAARLDQAALDEQLVEADALDPGLGGRRGAHPPIVAQRAAPGLTVAADRRQPAATSERPGVARSVSTASRTWAARPSASSRSRCRRSATEPWSTNRSPGIPRMRTASSR